MTMCIERNYNDMSNPYFSVILPIYNVEKYLERCVESVLSQNFTDYEMILVDDGSSDFSPKICDEYEEKYNFIKVIHKKNGGLSSARNAGFEQATGKYILWFDSDDWVEKNTLSLIYNATKESEVDIIKFNYIRHIDDNEILGISNAIPKKYEEKKEIDELITLALCSAGKYSLSACMHAYRTQFLNDNSLKFISEREVGSEDFLFNIEALLSANSVVVLKDALYHYDLRIGSLTQRGYKKQLPEKYTYLFSLLKDYLKQKGMFDIYIDRLSYFYVWSLIYGTCIANEYKVTDEHSLKDGRKNVKRMFSDSEFIEAIRMSDKSVLTRKQLIQLYAMRFQVESLFYWLFVKKPE